MTVIPGRNALCQNVQTRVGGKGGGGGRVREGGLNHILRKAKGWRGKKIKLNKTTGKDEKIGFMLESRLNKHSFTGTSSSWLVG